MRGRRVYLRHFEGIQEEIILNLINVRRWISNRQLVQGPRDDNKTHLHFFFALLRPKIKHQAATKRLKFLLYKIESAGRGSPGKRLINFLHGRQLVNHLQI